MKMTQTRNDKILKDGSPLFFFLQGGGCQFDQKVLNAQKAGASVVIIADSHPNTKLVQMSGSGKGINIPSVLIGYYSGLSIKSSLSNSCQGIVAIHPGASLVTIRVLIVAFLCIVGMCAILSIVLVFRRARMRTVVFTPTAPSVPSGTSLEAFEEVWRNTKTQGRYYICARRGF